MYILIVQTEEEDQQRTGIEKEALLLTISQKAIRQLVEELDRIQ